MIKVGDIVRGTGWPETVEIKKIELIDGEYFIVEALGKNTNKYYETLMDKIQLENVLKLNISDSKNEFMDTSTFKRYLEYLYFKIEQKYSSSKALGGKNLIPLPHQIEAVYGTMLQAPQVRFLLADDPGAGKTIMAGMLIRELKARAIAQRILILVPPLVLKQWQEELKSKFNEDFKIITRNTLNEGDGKNPFDEYPLCLASLYWAARHDVKELLIEANYDMLIVDEAHKMAAYTQGTKKKKTKKTKIYQLGEAILKKTEHRLLLTATPHKGDIENYRHLLKLVDEDIFANVSVDTNIKEKSNPFVIRRLKEQMVNFDGTPIFPERKTKTLQFDLSNDELELYRDVTNYVSEHFNRAEQRGNKGTSFAMMLLQRRLSSSIDAIYFSLERRHAALFKLLESSIKAQDDINMRLEDIDFEDLDDESYDDQAEIEELLEKSEDSIDINELIKEIDILEGLIKKAEAIRIEGTERKYIELEKTLFGENGIIEKGEKIIIFTEAVDTLNFIENKLKDRVSGIAKIIGKFSMDERRRQVELFRNELPVMLATDAGGESINLQFCNQMVNYDIPWNPNKLEQRMGRIHRIGQKNNVVVFNLVAKNTREGDVMYRLLTKMEQMQEDLGKELVFDFIGEILEDNNISLAALMEEAIRNRTNLDELVSKMEKTLSEEHAKLIQLTKAESLEDNAFDLTRMRNNQNLLKLKAISSRVYTDFVNKTLTNKNVKITRSGSIYRIDRLPKSIRDFARKKLNMGFSDSNIKYTNEEENLMEYQSEDIAIMQDDHSLFKLSMLLTESELEKIAMQKVEVHYPTLEKLDIEIYEISISDGTGREILNELLYVATSEGNEIFKVDPYFMQYINMDSRARMESEQKNILTSYAIKYTEEKLIIEKNTKSEKLDKKSEFLRRTFEAQYKDTIEKLSKYRSTNVENNNSALINQMNTRLIEIEEKKEIRIEEINRERTIQMRPPKKVLKITLVPDNSTNKRIIINKYEDLIYQYEKEQGRTNIKMQRQFGLVDFYSETQDGKPRYIILIDDLSFRFDDGHRNDLQRIREDLLVYYINNNDQIVEVDKRIYI
ncbi:DEAD/DEAH box helicase [Clostridium sp. FP2]|uniref:helicase-related protein n=1 Tax=Clostridium sp. FP2 TaxID=2724481 RepID=UPI0013E968F0|nr:helicase-related protein [Clostridium sp. FP2]MBZ9624411.1 DEAD/DEAH box helicase [Clostridium sp. FP2]